ncbi:gliding motility lipoprotein GldB [Poritiphilus flavus]|uniref:Gliding motility lipoprotein GldB n=2 Tax=Poritiphilus flavus TaxID=2697053 RepID=A0A6L9EGW2_9FLAO|nr:gliding motility lipoprotein GldB [Poritiphilus flavus]
MVFAACREEDKTVSEIAGIEIDLEVLRFDQEFSRAEPEEFPKLKARYPYLFPGPDSVWLAKMEDTLHLQLFQESEKLFEDFEQEKDLLSQFFKHSKYYFPQSTTPKVITLINNVDYEARIILADTLLLIGLDNYLGSEHGFYRGIDRYIAAGMDKQYLTSDLASAFAKSVVRYPSDRSFLARMIYYGKELYLKDKLLPGATEAQRIGYTPEQLEWARENEEQIWRYFIEKELLYSTDLKLGPRFLDPAPFSKFRLELDNESPGRLGRYMGWQIVRAFADKNELELKQILALPEEEIFKRANYKPKK